MNHTQFLADNTKALTAAQPQVAAWLAANAPAPETLAPRLRLNRWNMLDVELEDGRRLFDAFPPQFAYRSWPPTEQAERSGTIIVGANLGYGINHMLEQTPPRHRLLVVEPDPAMLSLCLGLTDYRPFIESGRLTFVAPQFDALVAAVRGCDKQFLFGRILLQADLPSQQIGPAYAHWTRICREQLDALSVELSTLRRAQDVMVGNELSNFRRALADGDMKSLRGALGGLPAVIAGAGPSLAASAPAVARLEHRALVTAALQTLPAMQAVGIRPHLALCIDYSDGIFRVYDRLDPEWARHVPLIYSTKVQPEVVRRYPGPTLPLWTVGGMATFIAGKDDLVLDAAGNVSVALLRLLHWMGAGRMVLAGQDFGWRGEASHATGHHAAAITVGTLDLPGRDGPVRSTLPYATALLDMEQDIRTLQLDVVNLYGGGALIRGARAIAPDDLNRELPPPADGGNASGDADILAVFRQRLDAAMTPCEQPLFAPRLPQWRTSLRNAQKRLETLFRKPERHGAEIVEMLGRVHFFLRQDPICTPYLYNEIMDVSGLVHGRDRFGLPQMTEFRQIARRVLDKIRRIDEVMTNAGRQAA
uniref:6-hydroxymethylpterin diphosphokinase MptE-like domain-containing protein n=1 Tax=Nitratidesulfovibrio vulgaris (strain DSM 19637 / Miyazaki F) TaxID=883 RepID=B8DJH2_NITV9